MRCYNTKSFFYKALGLLNLNRHTLSTPKLTNTSTIPLRGIQRGLFPTDFPYFIFITMANGGLSTLRESLLKSPKDILLWGSHGGYVRDFSAIAIASRTMLPQFLDETLPHPSRDTISSTPRRLAISCFKASDINPCLDIRKPPCKIRGACRIT